MRSLRHRLLAVAAVSVAALAAGCGDDNGGSASTDTATIDTQATQTTPAQPAAPKAKKVQPAAGEGELDRKPKVPKGKGKPPSGLVVQDVIVGKGKKAKSGDTVSVRYVGVLFDNGKQFDASWKAGKGQTFQFPLGAGQVIPGWDQGVAGMKEGGRRKLIIPPDLAYGAQGFPPKIPPDSTLIFDIDLVKTGS